MKISKILASLSAAFLMVSCSSDGGGLAKADDQGNGGNSHIKVDYSKGRAMNARLGRGINLGNSWDSKGRGSEADCGWGNCIDNNDFAIIKAAGFNSVRIPVRWSIDAGTTPPYDINAGRLAGVREDVALAIANGLAVIINFHHYDDMSDDNGQNTGAAQTRDEYPELYAEELQRFAGMWTQVAAGLNDFPDDMVVFEIMNEPHDIKKTETINEIMLTGYVAIRAAAPGKTIMFEGNGYSKFNEIKKLSLPKDDGNIIVSGHYYDPYELTHQGTSSGYACGRMLQSSDLTKIKTDFRNYTDSIKTYFPDIDGVHSVPVNMGEFGLIGKVGSFCGDEAPTESMRAQWTQYAIQAAESYGISWHYWAYGKTSGFQAYDQDAGAWFPEMKAVFDYYTVQAFPQ